jgi:hypothetical protein
VSLIFSKIIKKKQKSLPESCSFRKDPLRIIIPKETPGCACLTGSMTLEAAVIVPALACLFAFVLFFFRMMQVELSVQNALEDTGRTLAVYAAVKDCEEEEYKVLAKSIFLTKVQQEENIRKYVTGNALGIIFSESSFSGNDICLKAHYQMKFPVGLLGKKAFWMSQQTIYRKWTGWRDESGISDEDRFVYIAEQGTVYHKTSACTYLNLSIQSIDQVKVAEYRNESGEKYHQCKYCADKINKFEKVYITNYGNKYHTVLNCSGIKRTIEMVRLSEVEGKGACSKCWQK